MITISYRQLIDDCKELADKIDLNHIDSLYAIPRGGVPIGLLLHQFTGLKLLEREIQVTPATLIVDDLVDSGKTLSKYPYNASAVLYRKPHSPQTTYHVEEIDDWIEFPYEQTNKDEQDNIIRLLETLGENPTREGLQDTPKRVMKFYREFLTPPEFNFTTFEGENYDEMIIQKDIPFFSLCEHHLAPFFGTATVAYIPDGKIVGLSKLARTVETYARRLQNQERITSQIAERLQAELDPLGVAVTLKARHFCMEMRGVKTHDVTTSTTKLLGVFKTKPEARSEFLATSK
jgi:GTP cyclohydrolase I